MTASAPLPEGGFPLAASGRRGRAYRRLTVGIVAGSIVAIGIIWWYATRPDAEGPIATPPSLPASDGIDPEVLRVVNTTRQEVIKSPRSGASWGNLGMVFGAHGFEEESDFCFKEAERFDPNNPRWPYYRGLLAIVREPGAATTHLRRALDLGPDTPAAFSAVRMKLAEVYLEQGALEQAEILFKQEIRSSRVSPRAMLGLGQIAMIRGDATTARQDFTVATESPFARKKANAQLAVLARAAGETARAAQYEDMSRKLPNDLSWPDPYLVKLRNKEVGQQGLLREAESLEAAGQLLEAYKILQPLVESDPSPKVLVAAGINLAKRKEYTEAEAILRECLRREPDFTQAHYFLAVVLFQRYEPYDDADSVAKRKIAAEHARHAVALKPDHGLGWLYLGRILLALRETDEARKALRQAVDCRPDLIDTHLYLAEALLEQGDWQSANDRARVAEKMTDPRDPRPRQLLERIKKKQVGPTK